MRDIVTSDNQFAFSTHNTRRSITPLILCVGLTLASTLTLSGCGSVESSAAATLPAARSTALIVVPKAAANPRPALVLANTAFHDSRFVAPAGNNALEHALHALQQDANSAGANEILADITPIAASTVEANIAARDFAEAERVVALLATANPSSLIVKSLRHRLAVAVHRAAAPPVVAGIGEG